MADLWRVTYMGDGVLPTAVGAFAKHVTAYVEEDFARSLAGQHDWVVADPSGNEVGARKKPAEPPKAPEKPAEKPEAKAEKAEKAEKPEKAEKYEKTEKVEKPAAEKAEKK
jgi:hypothetical protein